MVAVLARGARWGVVSEDILYSVIFLSCDSGIITTCRIIACRPYYCGIITRVNTTFFAEHGIYNIGEGLSDKFRTHFHSCSAQSLDDFGVSKPCGLVQRCLSPSISLIKLHGDGKRTIDCCSTSAGNWDGFTGFRKGIQETQEQTLNVATDCKA